MPDIAITGLGAIAPNGAGVEAFWKASKEGVSGIGPVTRFDASNYSCQIAGEVSLPLPLSEELPVNGNHNLSFSSKLIISAALMALKDAGISREKFSSLSSGIWAGTSSNDMTMVEQEYEYFKESGVTREYVLSSAYPHAAAKEMGGELRCLGPVTTISIGCSSGMYSIMFAAIAIARGEIDVALAGGGDAPITPFMYSCFCSGGLLTSSFNGSPQKASRPFDAGRDGGVLSEGAGMIVLENAERAVRSKKRIYGYLTGWHASNAYNHSVMGNAFRSSMAGALKSARLSLSDIDFISANAPGDRFIDAVEVRAVEQVFSRYAYNIPMSSIKSSIGNPLAAAGPLQVISSLQAMKDSYVPPTINLEKPKPNLGMDHVPKQGRFARVENVLLNTQGMGGSNLSFVLQSTSSRTKQVW